MRIECSITLSGVSFVRRVCFFFKATYGCDKGTQNHSLIRGICPPESKKCIKVRKHQYTQTKGFHHNSLWSRICYLVVHSLVIISLLHQGGLTVAQTRRSLRRYAHHLSRGHYQLFSFRLCYMLLINFGNFWCFRTCSKLLYLVSMYSVLHLQQYIGSTKLILCRLLLPYVVNRQI